MSTTTALAKSSMTITRHPYVDDEVAEAVVNGVEVWREIPEFEGRYEASTMGRIRSLERRLPRLYHGKWASVLVKGGVLCPMIDRRADRAYVGLRHDGVKKRFLIYRLIALTFVANPYGKTTVNHRNGVKCDDRAVNLEWATYQEQNDHSRNVLGYKNTGVTNRCSKLTWNDVDDIRILHSYGPSSGKIARLFGISQANASRVIRGVLWRECERPKYVS